MAKVTSKYQVTVPKAIADQYGIRPGSEISWVPAGDAIRVIPLNKAAQANDPKERLRRFDQATKRHEKRPFDPKFLNPPDRGWKREDLYEDRGRTR